MGRRRVGFTYSVDIDLAADIEWPESGGGFYRQIDEDPREVTAFYGEDDLSKAVLAVLEEDGSLDDDMQCQAIEAHDNACREEVVFLAVQDHIRRKYGLDHLRPWRAEKETDVQQAARHEREEMGQRLLQELDELRDSARREALGTVKNIEKEEWCEVEHGDWSGRHRREPSCPDAEREEQPPLSDAEVDSITVYHVAQRARAYLKQKEQVDGQA